MIKPLIFDKVSGFSYAQNSEDLLCKILFEEFSYEEQSAYKSVVDIGASDGITLSNSRLFVEMGFKSLLVDGDKKRYLKAKSNSAKFDNCYVSNKFVNSENCETLLELAGIEQIGILSIDVDGPDLIILRGLIDTLPQIIVIEYNPTIPLHVNFEQTILEDKLGNSALAIYQLMKTHGYFLRFATQTNLIFSIKSGDSDLALSDLLTDEETVRGVWVGYDGSVMFEGRIFLEFPWHGLDQRIRISGVPRYFKEFYGGGSLSPRKAAIWSKFRILVNLRDRILSRLDQI